MIVPMEIEMLPLGCDVDGGWLVGILVVLMIS